MWASRLWVSDTLTVMTDRPQSCILMARISDARDGVTAGVDDQLRDLRAHAARIGWGIGREVVENDVSSYKRRRVTLPDGRVVLRVWRPEWRQALDDLAAGRHDGLLVVDLDRATRDPRLLEDLIDTVEGHHPRIPVESIHGSLRLASDADITMARVMCTMANKASRDTARRVRRARLRQAEEGRYGGGIRRYGHEADGVTVIPEEATVIRWAAEQVVTGVSMRMIAATLRQRGVPTPTGRGQWSPQALKGILTRPSTAGLVIHQGTVLDGVEAVWEPILARDVWETVRVILSSPDRTTTPGPAPRWLGSGLYLCGHPDCINLDPRPTLVVSSSNGGPAYRCMRLHLTRKAAPLDDLVERHIIAVLSLPDIHALTARQPGVDTSALTLKAAALRARIREAGDLWEDGTIDAAELKARRARLGEKLAAVEAALHAATGTDALAGIAGAPDPGVLWEDMHLGRQRAVLDALLTVEVLPAARRGRPRKGEGIDPDSIRISRRRPPAR